MGTDATPPEAGSPENQKRKSWLSRFRAESDKHVETEHEVHIGSLKFRIRSPRLKIVSVICSSIVFIFLLRHFVSEVRNDLRTSPELRPTIAVFVPDSNRSSEGAFYQDGAVQRRGFEKAKQDADGLPNKLDVMFQSMRKEDTPDALLSAMKDLYSTNGATFFVMTMSGKVGKVRKLFCDWHDECVRQKKREPILIATVASAPDLADASSGVLRWYVRSDEESSLLAEYLRWKLAVTNAVVFYITQTPLFITHITRIAFSLFVHPQLIAGLYLTCTDFFYEKLRTGSN